jgi:hypothetical protein
VLTIDRAMRNHSGVRSPLRTLVCIVALLATSSAPVLAYAAPLLAGEAHVECCCGEHSANEACGCSECPAAVLESERRSIAEGDYEALLTDRIAGCGQDDPPAVIATMIDWATPPAAPAPPRAWRAQRAPPLANLLHSQIALPDPLPS